MGHKPFVQDKGPSHRPARIAQIVKEELATMIPGDLKDPRLEDIGFITITAVTVTNDLKNATVMFSLMSEDDRKKAKDIEAALNKAAGFLRHELMPRLQGKGTPLLNFKFDKGFENTGHIDELLKTIPPAKAGEEE